jgi:hypothetical protein
MYFTRTCIFRMLTVRPGAFLKLNFPKISLTNTKNFKKNLDLVGCFVLLSWVLGGMRYFDASALEP